MQPWFTKKPFPVNFLFFHSSKMSIHKPKNQPITQKAKIKILLLGNIIIKTNKIYLSSNYNKITNIQAPWNQENQPYLNTWDGLGESYMKMRKECTRYLWWVIWWVQFAIWWMLLKTDFICNTLLPLLYVIKLLTCTRYWYNLITNIYTLIQH